MTPVDDTMLMSYALDGGRGPHGMDELAERHLRHTCMPFDQVIQYAPGAKQSDKTFGQVPFDKATEYAAEDADITLRLWMLLKPRLVAERMVTVYETLERPLIPVIAGMERAGIKVDRAVLSKLSSQFAQGVARLEEEINEPRRPQVQPGLAAPARRVAVRPLEAARRQEDQDRPVGDARRPARRARQQRGAARQRAPARQYHAGVAPAHQAALHLHRCAARLHQRGDRPHPHQLCAGLHARPGGWRPASPTCRTSRSAPRKAAPSARRSSPTRAPG